MPSVIIPAHNEEAVIARCLKSLLEDQQGDLQIVVVPNGCKDRTAEIARSFGDRVVVVESDIPSKANSLNVGDQYATKFPRFFIDADVHLSPGAIEQVAKVLQQPGIFAAAPLPRINFKNRSWPVRAFYQVWLRLPSCRNSMIGSGVYALNEAGRKRFDRFPDITADDAFVRLQFSANERRTVTSCTSTVTPPTTLKKIIDIKTRSHFGNAELRKKFPDLWKNEEIRNRGPFLRMALNPLNWPSLAVYLYVKVATRRRVKQRFKLGQIHQWERDDSSRETTSEFARP